MPVTPSISDTSVRTAPSQCPQVIPVTWYSVVVAILHHSFTSRRLIEPIPPIGIWSMRCGLGFLLHLPGWADMTQPSGGDDRCQSGDGGRDDRGGVQPAGEGLDRKSTRLNSSHVAISYAVCCLKKKK